MNDKELAKIKAAVQETITYESNGPNSNKYGFDYLSFRDFYETDSGRVLPDDLLALIKECDSMREYLECYDIIEDYKEWRNR